MSREHRGTVAEGVGRGPMRIRGHCLGTRKPKCAFPTPSTIIPVPLFKPHKIVGGLLEKRTHQFLEDMYAPRAMRLSKEQSAWQ